MQNGCRHRNLAEFTKIGLIHSPSGRLLTSETFQGSLNVSGVSLKRKQVWTLYTQPDKPDAFLLQNHLGNFLSADNNGNVTLVTTEPGCEERFLIHFDPNASGEIALQSEKHGFYLQWTGTEMRCFSKEPVWWGMRLAMHPQIHLRSVHRSCFIRSAKKDSELRAVTKMPCSPKFLIWLQQLPLPSARGLAAPACTKQDVARLSRVALRTQSGRFLCANGSLTDSIDKATLFSVSFKPNASQVVLFQDENGDYLTVGGGGVLKVKVGSKEPRREEFFSIETPSIHVRLWAFNNKFACNKHGLTFSTTMEETEDHKSTIYQLEYVGGRGLDTSAIANATTTPAADGAALTFPFDGSEDAATYITSGLWRLRSQDGRLWQLPPTGCAQLAPKDCTEHTTFDILYVSSYEEQAAGEGKPHRNNAGGIVLRTPEGMPVCAKTLGAIGVSERPIDAAWKPVPAEVLHMVTLVNRTSIACYSILACGFLAPAIGRRTGGECGADCANTNPEQWFLRHLVAGTVQLFAKQNERWFILNATSQGNVTLVPSTTGPEEGGAGGDNAGTEFAICMACDKHALFRSVLPLGGHTQPGFLCANLQGGVKVDVSGTITPGCIWHI
ncbi:unnamed protein product [Mesocestoides corti]|uniref:Fascin n=1 Tax=Mesocestoides corti TaxID=53468 RepID=A0A0R3U1G8_MESCO|nr:unnamed protein product [Mesocestoides corti]